MPFEPCGWKLCHSIIAATPCGSHIPFFQVRTFRHREAKELVRDDTASSWQRQDSNPGSLAPELEPLASITPGLTLAPFTILPRLSALPGIKDTGSEKAGIRLTCSHYHVRPGHCSRVGQTPEFWGRSDPVPIPAHLPYIHTHTM